jgi:hypothetical protein
MATRSVRATAAKDGHRMCDLYYLELLRASKGTLRFTHQSALGHVVSFGPFSLCVPYKEGLCPVAETLIS